MKSSRIYLDALSKIVDNKTEEYIKRARSILKNQKLMVTSDRLKTVIQLIMQLEAEAANSLSESEFAKLTIKDDAEDTHTDDDKGRVNITL